ncbi:hypothetical protein Gasu2_05660 [Galdieria sulphuraria]|uniref:Uncharacterized protein n=1 Tax=Galdieria sulphuraria TaxID=130081 RepID=M2Y8J4_GALSU|nr:uncharacterized protein Gasu_04590 [Galdieria sulphuraria]EME32368.1 hypothetical protein Gasu_04590 [Galdieria sulphuraria]GJD06134.1 hypothetical protein Gasu2_05660 [Galdieria sulphuraria]|eukprot:XP_005708888.1 hypothetical protein Gasu_04590 [Galdieria sulphuraria]
MLRNVPTKNYSKQCCVSEKQPLLSYASSLLPSSHNREDSAVTISPLKEDNIHTVLNTEIPKENWHRNDLLLESLKELKQDLESIKKEHMEKDQHIQQLRNELSHKQMQLEEVWQKLEMSNLNNARQGNETAELQHEEIHQQILSIRNTFAQQLKTIENIEAKRISSGEDSNRMMDYLSRQVDPYVSILESFDKVCHSNGHPITLEVIRDILSKVFLAMKQNLDYLEYLQSTYEKYPEIVDRYEVTVYEKDSIIECQRAIIAVKTEQIEKLQQKLEQITLNGASASDSETTKNNSIQTRQRHFALVHGLMNVVDNILSRLFGDRSFHMENNRPSSE